MPRRLDVAPRYAECADLRCARRQDEPACGCPAGAGPCGENEFCGPARAEILRQNLERMGVTNAVITNEGHRQPCRSPARAD